MQKRVFSVALLMACSMALAGCMETDCTDDSCIENYGVNPAYTVKKAPLEAYCNINVQGIGTVDMETDYVPNVTWCENGYAADEALKVQSVSARTYGYYFIKKDGSICNSTKCQVYSCRAHSSAEFEKMKEMAKATSGTILMYHNSILCAFFVAGSEKQYLDSNCKFTGGSGSAGWVYHQDYVTYNWGKSGGAADGFKQSTIGYVADGNYENRGCMSQNGSACLAEKGWEWQNILKFFYGDDIVLAHADGSCTSPVEKPKCETVIDKSGVIIDDKDPCFSRSASTGWWEVNGGHDNHLWYTYAWSKAAEAIGTWTVNVTRPGKYEVFAYIDSTVCLVSEQALYKIRASGQEHTVRINMQGKNGWVSLGKFDFAAGSDQWVKLDDATGEPYTDRSGKRVLFDAIKFEDVSDCTNACDEGKIECSGNGLKTCEKGANNCTAWSAVVPCKENEQCSENECKPVGCQSECAFVGEHECKDNGYRICEAGENGCNKWSAVTGCPEGNACVNGVCPDSEVSCTDACIAKEMKCIEGGGGYQLCGSFNEDSCLEWSQVAHCGAGETCIQIDSTNASCGPNTSLTCKDECLKDERKCSGSGFKMCGQFDDDECLEWSEVTNCGDEEACTNGVCSSGGGDAKCLTQVKDTETIIDDLDSCFTHSDSSLLSEMGGVGYQNDHVYYTRLRNANKVEVMGTWNLNVMKADKYSIYVYVDGGIGNVAPKIQYHVKAAGKELKPTIIVPESQSTDKDKWLKLGNFELAEGGDQYVQLWDIDSSIGEENYRIIFDAIKVVPYSADAAQQGENPEPEEGDSDSGDTSSTSASSDCSAAGKTQSQTPAALLAIMGILGALGIARRRRDGMTR